MQKYKNHIFSSFPSSSLSFPDLIGESSRFQNRRHQGRIPIDEGRFGITKKICICFLSLIFCFLFFVYHSYAKQTIEVYPAIFEIKTAPDTSTEKILTIKNQSEDPFIFRVYLSPLDITDHQTLPIKITPQIPPLKIRGDEGGLFENLRSWISLNTSDTVLLQPFSEKQLQISINIPSYAYPAGYYSQIIIEPLISDKNKNSLQIVPIFSIPLLIDVMSQDKTPEFSLALNKVELTGKFESQFLRFVFNKIFKVPTAHAESPIILAEKSPFDFKITLKNLGKYLTRAQGKISIYDLDGQKLANNDFSEVSLLPNEIKSLDVKTNLNTNKLFSFALPKRLKAVIETGDSRDELIFWVFSYKKSLSAFATIISLMLLILFRRRLYRALRVLFTE